MWVTTRPGAHATSEAFRAAHSRLFDHLCETTEHRPDTLPSLQPLYQAVTHGCLAGRQEEACDKVYVDRILRGTGSDGYFSSRKLGAIGADLGAVAAFFDSPWQALSSNLSEAAQAWLLNEATFSLRAIGRLTDARDPMRVSIEMAVAQDDWTNSAIFASNRSGLEVTLGLLDEAVTDGRRAIELADRSENAFWRMGTRTTAADALHQRGLTEPTALAAGSSIAANQTEEPEASAYGSDLAESRALFEEAERIQAERQPHFPLLYSTPGFRYADLILAPAERGVWKKFVVPPLGGKRSSVLANTEEPPEGGTTNDALAACTEAQRRALWSIETRQPDDSLLFIALDHLTLARAHLYRAVLESDFPIDSALKPATSELNQAVHGLRQAGQSFLLCSGLLTAALLEAVRGEAFVDRALVYLAEAQQIAERGPMPLYLADVHLHRARIVGSLKSEVRRVKFPEVDVKAELRKARELILNHKYGRRREELNTARLRTL